METLAAKASPKKTYELVLPDIESMRASDLQRLVNIGTIRSLHLGTTPHIRLAAAMKLLAASSITHFTHPVLYARCFDLTVGTQFATPEKSWSKIFPCGDGTNFPLRHVVYVTTGLVTLTSHVSAAEDYTGRSSTPPRQTQMQRPLPCHWRTR